MPKSNKIIDYPPEEKIKMFTRAINALSVHLEIPKEKVTFDDYVKLRNQMDTKLHLVVPNLGKGSIDAMEVALKKQKEYKDPRLEEAYERISMSLRDKISELEATCAVRKELLDKGLINDKNVVKETLELAIESEKYEPNENPQKIRNVLVDHIDTGNEAKVKRVLLMVARELGVKLSYEVERSNGQQQGR